MRLRSFFFSLTSFELYRFRYGFVKQTPNTHVQRDSLVAPARIVRGKSVLKRKKEHKVCKQSQDEMKGKKEPFHVIFFSLRNDPNNFFRCILSSSFISQMVRTVQEKERMQQTVVATENEIESVRLFDKSQTHDSEHQRTRYTAITYCFFIQWHNC